MPRLGNIKYLRKIIVKTTSNFFYDITIRENKSADTLNKVAFWNDRHKCIGCCYLVEAASKKLFH